MSSFENPDLMPEVEQPASAAYANLVGSPLSEGVEPLTIEVISTMLGEVNTEARGVVVAATPQEWTKTRDIRDFLHERDAFKHVHPDRFNITSILRSAHPKVISYFSEPSVRKAWAKKDEGPIGTCTNAMAGAMLRFSDDYAVSVRTLIGEKVAGTKENQPSIEARLGVLATILAFTQEDTPFSTTELGERIEESFGLDPGTARNNIYRLAEAGYLQAHGTPNRRKYSTAERPDGTDSYDTIKTFITIVGAFANRSQQAIEQGTQDAKDILEEPEVLANLVDRSYEASSHTGKTFTRRSA